MKLGIVLEHFDRRRGGLEHWTWQFSRNMAARGHEVPEMAVVAVGKWGGGELTYARLIEEFLLERRTAERYLADLRRAGLPVESKRRGRQAVFTLAQGRSRDLRIEAVDVPPADNSAMDLVFAGFGAVIIVYLVSAVCLKLFRVSAFVSAATLALMLSLAPPSGSPSPLASRFNTRSAT